jgi:hypothetical protein
MDITGIFDFVFSAALAEFEKAAAGEGEPPTQDHAQWKNPAHRVG